MTKNEAISVLSACKPTIQNLMFFEEAKGFSKDELKILKMLQEMLQVGFLQDNELLKLAGYSIIQASLLLGALDYYSRNLKI